MQEEMAVRAFTMDVLYASYRVWQEIYLADMRYVLLYNTDGVGFCDCFILV